MCLTLDVGAFKCWIDRDMLVVVPGCILPSNCPVLSRKLPPMNRRYQDREREREERLLGLDSHCRRLQA